MAPGSGAAEPPPPLLKAELCRLTDCAVKSAPLLLVLTYVEPKSALAIENVLVGVPVGGGAAEVPNHAVAVVPYPTKSSTFELKPDAVVLLPVFKKDTAVELLARNTLPAAAAMLDAPPV